MHFDRLHNSFCAIVRTCLNDVMVVLDNLTAANMEPWFVDFFLFQKWLLLSLLANYP